MHYVKLSEKLRYFLYRKGIYLCHSDLRSPCGAIFCRAKNFAFKTYAEDGLHY